MTGDHRHRPGALGRYWEDLSGVLRDAMQRHVGVAARLWQDVSCGAPVGQTARDLAQAGVEVASTLTYLGLFPFEWLTREMMHVPALVLMVDAAAESTAPTSTRTPVAAAGLPIVAGDLEQLGGTHRIDASHVGLRLCEGGDRLEVWLSDLGGIPEERARRGIVPGHYVGVVHVDEAPARRPLVLLHVVINGPS